jgi:hypothetical protein
LRWPFNGQGPGFQPIKPAAKMPPENKKYPQRFGLRLDSHHNMIFFRFYDGVKRKISQKNYFRIAANWEPGYLVRGDTLFARGRRFHRQL